MESPSLNVVPQGRSLPPHQHHRRSPPGPFQRPGGWSPHSAGEEGHGQAWREEVSQPRVREEESWRLQREVQDPPRQSVDPEIQEHLTQSLFRSQELPVQPPTAASACPASASPASRGGERGSGGSEVSPWPCSDSSQEEITEDLRSAGNVLFWYGLLVHSHWSRAS